jgi:hypothetical protein
MPKFLARPTWALATSVVASVVLVVAPIPGIQAQEKKESAALRKAKQILTDEQKKILDTLVKQVEGLNVKTPELALAKIAGWGDPASKTAPKIATVIHPVTGAVVPLTRKDIGAVQFHLGESGFVGNFDGAEVLLVTGSSALGSNRKDLNVIFVPFDSDEKTFANAVKVPGEKSVQYAGFYSYLNPSAFKGYLVITIPK